MMGPITMADASDPTGRLNEALCRRVRELTLLHEAGRIAWDRRAGTAELIGPIVEQLPSLLDRGGQAAARLRWGALAVETEGFQQTTQRLRSASTFPDGTELVLEVGCAPEAGDTADGSPHAGARAGAGDPEAARLLEAVREVLAQAITTRQAHDRLELVLAATGAGLWEWDVASARLTVSADVEMLLGLGPGDFDGTLAALRRHVHPADRRRALGALRRALAGPSGVYRDELRVVAPGGEVRWLAASGQVLWSDSGSSRVAGMVADVTARRALEEQVRQSHRLEAVAALSAGIAHDFNNALSVVLAYTGFALGALPPQSPARADLEEVRAAAERAAALTRRLLIFGRQRPLEPRPTDVNETVRGMERLLRAVAGNQIELALHLGDAAGRVLLDPGLLDEVVVNLTVAAREATPAGGRIVIRTGREQREAPGDALPRGSYVWIAVGDCGCGVSAGIPCAHERDCRRPRAEGDRALALAAVAASVRGAGGYLSVCGASPGQCGFLLWFPALRREPERLEAAEPPPPVEPEPALVSGAVLVVEDDAPVRALVQSVLASEGYRVVAAASAGDALVIAADPSEPVALLVADMGLPGMTGLELATRLRAAGRPLAVLILSGAGEPPGLRGLGEPIAFLDKPLLPGSLVAAVRALLARARHAYFGPLTREPTLRVE